ncbi:hypothetical protein [Infirmifilum sp.]|jgi:hypothetical protein|uniref:hypothetical protein n=1 Tax=Infirmifilum sp. TaxID=2856575 RepID=UPI003D114958
MFKDFVWVALDGVGIPLFYKVGYTLGAMLATSAVSPATFVRTMMYRLVDMLPSRGKRVAPRRSPSVGIAGKQVKGFYVGKDGKIYLVTE